MLDIQKRLTNSFYAILSLPATAMGFALSVQIAALSWIMSYQYEMDIHEVGWVWLAGPLAGIIGQLLVGVISDKTWFWGGRRRPYIWIGGVVAAVMLYFLPRLDVIAGALNVSNFLILALGVALTLDLAINVSFNPTRSIIADVTPEGVPRTKGYTWMQTVSGFFGVGAYLIGAFSDNYTLISVGIVLVLVFSILPPFFIEEPRLLTDYEVAEKVNGSSGKDMNQVHEQEGNLAAGHWKIYIAHGFTWIGIQTMFVFIFAFIEQKMDLPTPEDIGKTIGYAFAILNTVGFLLPAFVLEPITEKIGRVKTHLACIAIMALGYLGIYLAGHTPMMLYLFMVVCGIGWAATVSLPFAIFTEKVKKEEMGLKMGIFNLSVVIPQIIVSGLIGLWISNMVDKGFIFVICAVSLGISALLWTLVREA